MIDWKRVPDSVTIGEELVALVRELFTLPRSLTGNGVRATLGVLARELPLEIIETPTGTPVFDWVVPREWNLRGAWIDGPDGIRVVDAADSPLHVLGYSTPVDAVIPLEELRAHVHTHRDDPDLVPFRTSYWEEQWGFCMSSRQLEGLPDGDYHVVVDATLEAGSLTSGEIVIPGRRDDEFRSAPTSATRRSQTTTSRASSSSGRSAVRFCCSLFSTPTVCSGAPGHSVRCVGWTGTAPSSIAFATVSSSRASATPARSATSAADVATRPSTGRRHTSWSVTPGS